MSDTDDRSEFHARIERASAAREARLRQSMHFLIEDLPDIDHGVFNQPLSIGEGLRIETPAGDALLLDDIFQYRTHGGQLLGLPIFHKENISSAVDYARSIFPNHKSPPYVVPPTMHRGTRRRIRNGVEEFEDWRILPPITSFGMFTTTRPARDTDEPYSSILLIWYQDKFGLPDDSRTLKLIAELDWEPFAHGWSP